MFSPFTWLHISWELGATWNLFLLPSVLLVLPYLSTLCIIGMVVLAKCSQVEFQVILRKELCLVCEYMFDHLKKRLRFMSSKGRSVRIWKMHRRTLWSGASDRVLFCCDLCSGVLSENLGLTVLNVSFSQTSVPYLCYLLGTLCVCFLSNLVPLVWQSNELGVFLFYGRRNWAKIYILKLKSLKTEVFHCFFETCFVIWDETTNILCFN